MKDPKYVFHMCNYVKRHNKAERHIREDSSGVVVHGAALHHHHGSG